MNYILIIIAIVMTNSVLAQNFTQVNTSSVYQTTDFGFSQAILYQDLIFTSGQVGWNNTYQLPVDNDFGQQAGVAMENIEKILLEAKSDLQHVIHLRIYVVDLGIYEREVISKLLKKHYSGKHNPATTLLGISALARPNLRIEIEAIATTKTKSS
jgi:2-iminobutanoate/2-iminopropanoate deaminase